MITVVLTVWKRDNFVEQLEAIKNQTADIDRIVVYQNENHIDLSQYQDGSWDHVQSSTNSKYHGRFTLPLLFESEYTAVFDDDTIPAPKWLEHCVNTSKKLNCICGANGRNRSNKGSVGICDGFANPVPVKADIVGHCWFFKTEWIHYMWKEPTVSFSTGEDIQLCASAQIFGDIFSYVPSQPHDQPEVWGDTNPMLGSDEHASWKLPHHNPDREKLYEHYSKLGWITQ